MAKEWILNSGMNRFQLNFKRNVGAVSEEIRKCSPKSLEEWKEYYYSKVRSKEHIDELGQKLYIKITEVIASEVESITEEDCINYIHNMVINRTFDGYITEIKTIYGQLQIELDDLEIKIEPAPDKWDRLYNVDFFIKINSKYIGLQIKPISNVSHISEIYKEKNIQEKTHNEFTKKYGGNTHGSGLFYYKSRFPEMVRDKNYIRIQILDFFKKRQKICCSLYIIRLPYYRTFPAELPYKGIRQANTVFTAGICEYHSLVRIKIIQGKICHHLSLKIIVKTYPEYIITHQCKVRAG